MVTDGSSYTSGEHSIAYRVVDHYAVHVKLMEHCVYTMLQQKNNKNKIKF